MTGNNDFRTMSGEEFYERHRSILDNNDRSLMYPECAAELHWIGYDKDPAMYAHDELHAKVYLAWFDEDWTRRYGT